ncbi:UDP-3-O-(3-hydroxymyristoyl)glucosamine N-acyltransferase [Nitrogeniibacter mangrovi]|uniref:UDP-3-O-acylglucosamine N-acyltransferase n=1 Tax=Nitrogeniibacter mangrovi TaxID=2016596 RepID=A0A6C1B3R0_9RHOO|nr:UDP-3-O-(3-hydroxymyristoyl)glucosamine N-acyltransferase [Nitrogeniibacter mangrovi]QID18023.1 UDP-3-O-(3-hydroxymyristoyl)glucosamine N-acyltransferase [Nitrogeniibacter mangrovi]
MGLPVEQIVARLGGRLSACGDVTIVGVAPLDQAGEGQLSFLANPKYRAQLARTRASVVVVDEATEVPPGLLAIHTPNPYLYFARVVALLNPPVAHAPGVAASAVVAGAVHAGAHVAPNAVIEVGAVIGEDAVVGPGCVVGRDVHIGARTRLAANVTLYAGVHIGTDCLIHAGAVIGADGFGFARTDDGQWVKFPQIGSVRIGNKVEIGANTTIDRGAMSDTVIADGVKLDNQIQIGHNVEIGEDTAIAGCVGIAGSTRIGKRCMVGGQAGIIGHLSICDDVVISAGTLVTKSIRSPGVYTANLPLQTHADWVKNFSRLRHLDTMAQDIRTIEQRLDKGESES